MKQPASLSNNQHSRALWQPAFTVLTASVLACTLVQASDNLRPNLEEIWRAEYPLAVNSHLRPDIAPNDLMVYYTVDVDTELDTTFAQVYTIDKHNGQCLSRAEFKVTGQFEIKGHTFTNERLWVSLGRPEDHSAGRRTAVINWRTGGIEQLIHQQFNGRDVLLANNPIQVGNDMYFFESLAPTSERHPRSGTEFRQFFSIYHAETGQLIARGDVLNPITGAPHTREAYAEFARHIFIFDGTPFAMRLDFIRFMNLRNASLGNYTLGQPHSAYRLSEDRYVVGWHFDSLTHTSRPQHPIFGTRTRIYSWSPNDQPALLWDAFDSYGLTRLGGSWGSEKFWMIGPGQAISVFDSQGTLVKLIERVRPHPQVDATHSDSLGLLVLISNPDDQNVWIPALATLSGEVREIALPAGIVNEGGQVLLPQPDGNLLHVEDERQQKWLVFCKLRT